MFDQETPDNRPYSHQAHSAADARHCLSDDTKFTAPSDQQIVATTGNKKRRPQRSASLCNKIQTKNQISSITGIIKGRRLVLFWMYRFRSFRIFSLITP
jgi:hypothetical protein